MSLKKRTVMFDDIHKKVFMIGDIVTVVTHDGSRVVGRIFNIDDDKVYLDTSKEYCSDQVTVYFKNVYSIDKVE